MTELSDSLIEIVEALGRGEVLLYEHHECYTTGAFDQLLVHAHGSKAFQLMSELAARHAQVERSPQALPGYFSLLARLARQSATTEVPPGVAGIVAAYPSLSVDLRAWYRLEA